MCLKNLGCLRDSENFPARCDHWGDLVFEPTGKGLLARAVVGTDCAGLSSALPCWFSSQGTQSIMMVKNLATMAEGSGQEFTPFSGKDSCAMSRGSAINCKCKR